MRERRGRGCASCEPIIVPYESKMIRIGLMLDSAKVARWKYEVIQAIRKTGHAEIVLVIVNGANGKQRDLGSKIGHATFHGYRLMDQLLFPVRNDPFETVDLNGEIGGAKVLQVTPQMKKFSDSFLPEDLAAIKAENVDVLIRFGFRVLRGPILQAAKYGVWSFHHGDNHTHRGAPACFWEVADDHPTTGAIVQVLSEELDGGKTLARIWCSTNRYSFGRTRAELYWNCIQMLPRLIVRLDKEGFDSLQQSSETNSMQFYDRRLYRTPGNTEGAIASLRIFARVGAKMARKTVSKEQWRLLYTLEEDLGKTAIYRYKQLVPPKDRFWADPFVVKRDGHFHVFVEEFMYATNRGHISVITLDEKGNVVGEAKEVVREDYHLSYPFIFEHDNRLFMVPESSEDGSLWLYECEKLPGVWKKKSRLAEGLIAVDPTIFFHNGRWWMFLNVADSPHVSKYTYLHLYHSSDPTTSNWTPHPKNPVVSDARRARPAGKPFLRGGWLYRPSQDCAGGYGRGISINRVVTLDENNYEEVKEGWIGPHLSGSHLGIHTLNRCEDLTIFDALFRVPLFG